MSRQPLVLADKTAPIGLIQQLRTAGPIEDTRVISLTFPSNILEPGARDSKAVDDVLGGTS